jgi:upstream activation factor subunit UAF30
MPTYADTGFNKQLQLSQELSAFIGEVTSTRGQVVKALWDYIKEKNLQNPKDRREILCDKQLEKIFKRKKVTMFSMNKYLSQVSFRPIVMIRQTG